MNMPTTMARKPISRRGFRLSLATAAILWAQRGLRCRRGGVRESGGAGQSLTAMGIDLRHHRHPRQQKDLTRIGVQADFHRHPLHDLGEVAGGVFRRQQAEHGASARQQAIHPAMEGAVAVGIDRNLHRLPLVHPGQLGFLEIGDDIDAIDRNHAHCLLSGLHILAKLHALVADDAIDRRAQHGVFQADAGGGQFGLHLFDLDVGLTAFRRQQVKAAFLCGQRGGGARVLDWSVQKISCSFEVGLWIAWSDDICHHPRRARAGASPAFFRPIPQEREISMSLGPLQILLIVVVILLLFGAGKIPRLMGDVAKGVNAFKKGLKEDDQSSTKQIDKDGEGPSSKA